MTRQQFIEEIRRLSVEDRIALIEAISSSLREDLKSREEGAPAGPPEPEQAEAQASGEGTVPISRRLYGILKFDGDPPADEELKDAYAEYLLEKYS